MNTQLKSLGGLKRELTVELPIANFNNKFDNALNDMRDKAIIDGFRKGKVPDFELKRRYGDQLRTDAINSVVSDNLPKAFIAEKINPAGTPDLVKIDFNNKEKIIFVVSFEVFPEIEISDLTKLKIEQFTAKITKTDEQDAFENLTRSVLSYKEIEKKAVSKQNDKVVVNFEGFIDNKPFNGGKAKDFVVVIGAKSMIAGFEDGLIGKKVADKFDLNLKFPSEYHVKDLANKDVVFKITITKISTPEKIKIDDIFAKKFNKNSINELKDDLKNNIQQQLADTLEVINKNKIFKELLNINNIDVPTALINQEAERLKQEQLNKLKQQNTDKNHDIDITLFVDKAKKRVQLGMLVNKITMDNKIIATDEQIEKKLQLMSKQYGEDRQQMIDYYKSDKQALASVRSLVIEQLTSKFIVDKANIVKLNKNFNEIMRMSNE